MLPDANVDVGCLIPGFVFGQEFGELIGRTDTFDCHGKKFFAAVPISTDCRVVHGKETECLNVINPHGIGVAFKEQPILLCGFLKIALSLITLCPNPSLLKCAVDSVWQAAQVVLQDVVSRTLSDALRSLFV